MTQIDNLCINAIRTLAMDGVQKAKSGHPGAPMGLAPVGYTLFRKVLRHCPRHPDWPVRDRFILSAGHASMLLYSLLHLSGYRLTLDDLKSFRQLGSKTPGHPERDLDTGVEMTTGPLGQGFGASVGFAIAQRWLSARFTRPGHDIFGYRIYVICSDGDMMEGVSSEAASLAGHLGLGNIIALYDDNHISIEGPTSLAFSEDVAARFMAYGWHVQHVDDANDIEAVYAAIQQAQAETDRPSFIRVRSHIAFGSPNKQDDAEAHGTPLGEDEIIATKRNLGWPSEEPFYVPPEVYEEMGKCVAEGDERFIDWGAAFASYSEAYPDEALEYEAMISGRLPAGWDSAIPTFAPSDGPVATRAASGKVINALAARIPNLIGGSGDLAPSTNTLIKGEEGFSRDCPTGRNLHFGVREHAMGAAIHGMTLNGGVIPYGATFLTFNDYMRPPIRLAAMEGVRFIIAYTHDSIGLGEDGPTHQPVEQIAALRAVPNCLVIRPCDANETSEAWRVAIETKDRPVLLLLSRQALPVLDRSSLGAASGLQRGGYVLGDFGPAGLKFVVIATGSEVHPALDAAKRLGEEGIGTRMVSLPCWERFQQQPVSYRTTIIPPEVKARVAVEAATPFGWERFVGTGGAIVAMPGFGASAPAGALMERFGFTADRIIERAKRMLVG